MKLNSINIGEYLHLSEEEKEMYDFALKYSEQAEARDVLNFGDITEKNFGEVKDWQQRFTESDVFVKFLTIYYPDSIKLNVFDFFAAYRFIENEVIRISEKEAKRLKHEPSPEEEAAGLERFSQLGVGIQIDSLAMGQVWMYETIRSLPYKECFFKLVLDKINNDYERDYQKVIMNKSYSNG